LLHSELCSNANTIATKKVEIYYSVTTISALLLTTVYRIKQLNVFYIFNKFIIIVLVFCLFHFFILQRNPSFKYGMFSGLFFYISLWFFKIVSVWFQLIPIPIYFYIPTLISYLTPQSRQWVRYFIQWYNQGQFGGCTPPQKKCEANSLFLSFIVQYLPKIAPPLEDFLVTTPKNKTWLYHWFYLFEFTY